MSSLRPNPRITRTPLNAWSRAALKGCDWWVNTQILEKKPNWDANHGRVMYHVHEPTGYRTMGIGWTLARAVMGLLAAWERTGGEKYLSAAGHATAYNKNLQLMDRSDPLRFGGFREETPHSGYCFPRDGIEVAEGFLQWYKVTGDKEALYRAELFLGWYLRNAYARAGRLGHWTRPEIRFDGKKRGLVRWGLYQAGAGTIFYHAYLATRKAEYKRACVNFADGSIAGYLKGKAGPFSEPVPRGARMTHHTGADGAIHNDDGAGVSLLSAYRLTRNKKYLNAALRIAEYYRTRRDPIPMYSGVGSVANFLVEVDRATGKKTYRATAERLARFMAGTQARSKNKMVDGGFRGEDEPSEWYVRGGKPGEFVVTRTTAYAVLTLFKLEGLVWPRGYSPFF